MDIGQPQDQSTGVNQFTVRRDAYQTATVLASFNNLPPLVSVALQSTGERERK
jgi:hypothetical protein